MNLNIVIISFQSFENFLATKSKFFNQILILIILQSHLKFYNKFKFSNSLQRNRIWISEILSKERVNNRNIERLWYRLAQILVDVVPRNFVVAICVLMASRGGSAAMTSGGDKTYFTTATPKRFLRPRN